MKELSEQQIKRAMRLMDMLYKTITGVSFQDQIKLMMSTYPTMDGDVFKLVMDTAGKTVVDTIQMQAEQTQALLKDPAKVAELKAQIIPKAAE